MRPYTRPNRRPRPSVDRARHQITRAAYLQTCPRCNHLVKRHAIEDGNRVCIRGEGLRIACADCAETWARLPVTAAFHEMARLLRTPPRVAAREPALLALTGPTVSR
ncbi:hypothetical protein ACH5AL_15340 [Actinacidiphila glaucinigra]|uniref:hypothetical protein n=1 Tax=Actinacidiphila glaucinigra TaxID=235986 RepID=UPI0037A03E38